ncbi:MAG: hypothetical protein HC905_12275 [Bacteroidales bacterium]|nr:hypothetical protein [Bacteroidales bacterium]
MFKKDLKIKYTLELNNHAEKMGDLIYFTPIFNPELKENPFKIEKREYPVEFVNPENELSVIQVKIPAGYKVESLPKPAMINLSDKSCRFVYNLAVVDEQTLKLVITFNKNKTTFLPEEYNDLKSFYNIMIEKLNEKIVLKKV